MEKGDIIYNIGLLSFAGAVAYALYTSGVLGKLFPGGGGGGGSGEQPKTNIKVFPESPEPGSTVYLDALFHNTLEVSAKVVNYNYYDVNAVIKCIVKIGDKEVDFGEIEVPIPARTYYKAKFSKGIMIFPYVPMPCEAKIIVYVNGKEVAKATWSFNVVYLIP